MKKVISIFALVLVASCRAQEATTTQEAASTDAASSAPIAAQRVATEKAPGTATSFLSVPAAPSSPRMIVRSAEMRVVVSDTSKAVADATRVIEAAGGYVAGSQVWREGELLRARLTLRVPSEKLTPALAQLRAIAKRVENETVTSEDVSAEFVDLEARVRNLEATEEELRQLLVVARQNSRKASDVLEVHEQLTRIRAEVEQVKGRMRYLSEVTAMSAIALEMTPDALAQPVVEPGWQPLVVAKSAVRALVRFAQIGANLAIWLLIFGGPFALIAFAVWKAMRRRRTVS